MPAKNNKNTQNLLTLKPSTFVPSVVRSIYGKNSGDSVYGGQSIADYSSSSIGNSSSFRYDPIGSGIKSTQQLNIDWSAFENHTFFNSAQVKTNTAFDKLINQFPFDGTREEVEIFIDKLSGWEKYVYDNLPKNVGYQVFSGSTLSNPNNGTFITVKDMAGAQFTSLSRKTDGSTILNPGTKSLTMEFHLFVPEGANTEQVIAQKLNTTNNHGFSCLLLSNSSTVSGTVHFVSVSGSSIVSASADIRKGQWNHVAGVWNRQPLSHQWNLYISQSLKSSSTNVEIGSLDFDSADFYIGSGSSFSSYTPTTTLSGAVDEFRIWHEARPITRLLEYANKNTYAKDNLKLYFKFNEPENVDTDLVIDSSGNSLHGSINSYSFNTIGVKSIITSSFAGASPLLYEEMKYNPILFPEQVDFMDFREQLLTTAVTYDSTNSNIITRMVPRHFFLEGQVEAALAQESGELYSSITTSSLPNSSRLGSTQITLSLLYLMSNFFDEIKLHLQNFSTLNKVDYDLTDTVSDQFLGLLAEKHGIELPPLFVGSSIEQYINGQNYGSNYDTNNYSLQYIQNQIWRRMLININDIISSKGTIHSIKSFMRSVGIEPDNNFRIREYGGPTKRSLKVSRETKSEVAGIANFLSGGFASSPYLSSSRVEPGYPYVASTPSDGLLTSGSWTYEGTYILTSSVAVTQSLARMAVTGSGGNGLVANLIAGGTSGSLTLYVRSGTGVNSPTLTLSLTSSAELQNNSPWFISFGRQKGSEMGFNTLSSSYFLRAARQSYGEIVEEYVTSSFFFEDGSDVFSTIKASTNASGSYLSIGSGSFGNGFTTFLNSTSANGDEVRRTVFNGKVNNIRFWSKALSINEWREHVRNFKSLGVTTPLENFNFETKESGSFERLRLDVNMDQELTGSNNTGTITFKDFSQNNFDFRGIGFVTSSQIIEPYRNYYGLISPKFDEAATVNKVRVRSFQDYENVLNTEESYSNTAPLYELARSEEPTDNNKLTIDYSIVDTLNQDIINIFATLDEFDNAIGEPALMFSGDYPTLENLRKIYFNRLTDKINFKAFFEFYKWFDTNMGSFIQQLVPRKTNFNGINYVIESHVLERAKIQYYFDDAYLGDSNRDGRKSQIQLFSVEGKVKKT